MGVDEVSQKKEELRKQKDKKKRAAKMNRIRLASPHVFTITYNGRILEK